MRPPKLLIIYIAIIGPIFIGCLSMIVSGLVTLSLSGFAIDSSGRLYLGKDAAIEVYEGSTLKYKISPMTSRGYIFTIQSNDTILLSTASTVYTMNLNGEVLTQIEDIGTKTFNKLQKSWKTFTSSNGDEYIIQSNWGRTEIVSNNKNSSIILYKVPLLDYAVKLLSIFVFTSMFVCIPIIIYKWRVQPA